MTGGRAGEPGAAPAAVSLGLSAGVALLLGTVGYALVGFGVLTSCTNDLACAVTSCTPCRPAHSWLTTGAIGQGLIVVVAVTLLVLATRRPRVRRRATVCGALLTTAALAWVVLTTAVASSSF